MVMDIAMMVATLAVMMMMMARKEEATVPLNALMMNMQMVLLSP